MPFNERSRLDPSQVQDRRGIGRGAGVAVSGGLGLLMLLAALLLGVNPGDLIGLTGPPTSQSGGSAGDFGTLEQDCQTGKDANTRTDCRVVGFVNSIQAFWTDEFAKEGSQYSPATTVLFTGTTDAACGYANAAMGPFYCPSDEMVYLDISFFDDMTTRLGARGGPFAQGYVLAHEYGHHVQDLAGVLNQAAGSHATGPQSVAVQTELQADCLAGVWAHNATATGYLTQVTNDEIAQALDAAAAVGDDRIQRQSQGYVAPESWTHGSSAQRQQALTTGLQTGDPASCGLPPL
jgi:uncharacterized protein